MAGFISNGGFDFMSNQVIGDAAGPTTSGPPPHGGLLAIPGLQFINLSAPVEEGCNAADLAEPFGVLDLSDITTFVGAFNSGNLLADLDGNGILDLGDVHGVRDRVHRRLPVTRPTEREHTQSPAERRGFFVRPVHRNGSRAVHAGWAGRIRRTFRGSRPGRTGRTARCR
jgi:hypothetical protein